MVAIATSLPHLLVILHHRETAVVVTPNKKAGQNHNSDTTDVKKPTKQIKPVEIKEEKVCYIRLS